MEQSPRRPLPSRTQARNRACAPPLSPPRRLSKLAPPTALFRYACALAVLLYVAPPLLLPVIRGGAQGAEGAPPAGGDDAEPSVATWGFLVVHGLLLAFCGGTAFTTTFIIINNSCAREQRGMVNGASMACAALARTIGPTLGATSFAWSLTNHMGAPLDVFFVFGLCASLSAGTCLFAVVGLPGRRYDRTAEASVRAAVHSTADATAEGPRKHGATEVDAAPNHGHGPVEAGATRATELTAQAAQARG